MFTVHAGDRLSNTASVAVVGTPDPVPSASQLLAVPQLELVVPLQVGMITSFQLTDQSFAGPVFFLSQLQFYFQY